MDSKPKSRPGLSGLAGAQRSLTADILGLPVDTIANVTDLGRAGYGSVMSSIGRSDLAPDLPDRTGIVGSSDWIARQLSRTGALMGPVDPDSATDRAAFAFVRGSAGAIFGLRANPRRIVEAGALGGTSALAADQVGASTGNPALAIAAALLIGRGQRLPRDTGRAAIRVREAPGPSMRKQEREPEWQQIIADTLARLLPKAVDAGRASARQDRGNPGLSRSSPSSLVKTTPRLQWRPHRHAALNSQGYRSYRAGIDEFGVASEMPRRRGLGANPFQGKTFSEIARILAERDFSGKGADPAKGAGSYFHPRSGRKYYLDQGGQYGKVKELPHVDVHRMMDGLNLEKEGKRKFPLGDELIQRNKR